MEHNPCFTNTFLPNNRHHNIIPEPDRMQRPRDHSTQTLPVKITKKAPIHRADGATDGTVPECTIVRRNIAIKKQ